MTRFAHDRNLHLDLTAADDIIICSAWVEVADDGAESLGAQVAEAATGFFDHATVFQAVLAPENIVVPAPARET